MQNSIQTPTTPQLYNPKVKGPWGSIRLELGRHRFQRLLLARFGLILSWGTLAKWLYETSPTFVSMGLQNFLLAKLHVVEL